MGAGGAEARFAECAGRLQRGIFIGSSPGPSPHAALPCVSCLVRSCCTGRLLGRSGSLSTSPPCQHRLKPGISLKRSSSSLRRDDPSVSGIALLSLLPRGAKPAGHPNGVVSDVLGHAPRSAAKGSSPTPRSPPTTTRAPTWRGPQPAGARPAQGPTSTRAVVRPIETSEEGALTLITLSRVYGVVPSGRVEDFAAGSQRVASKARELVASVPCGSRSSALAEPSPSLTQGLPVCSRPT